MNLSIVKKILDAELILGEENLNKEIDSAFSSDLMSDVLAYANKRTLLLTGLANAQVIRTAEMIDLSAIVFVRNKRPDSDIIKLAAENGIVIMSTGDTLYTASGKLYRQGLQGIQIGD
jgi:predicted transcriptional regulator